MHNSIWIWVKVFIHWSSNYNHNNFYSIHDPVKLGDAERDIRWSFDRTPS